jgi:diacylglycerol kinase family enzyme
MGETKGELVLVGNGNYYGGQFNLFPRANLADGKLDVLIFPRVRWLTLLELGWGWMTDQLHRVGGAVSFQSERLTLEGDPSVLFELDGDNIGSVPVTFSIRPEKLRVICQKNKFASHRSSA